MQKSIIQLPHAKAAGCLVMGACAMALASCSRDSRAIEACEAALLPTLKAPSSYKRVSEMVGPTQSGRQSVIIAYDAVNSYNAPIRDTFLCDFNPATGEGANAATLQDQYADDMSAANETAEPSISDLNPPNKPAGSFEQEQPTASTETGADEEVPVCDRPDSPEKSALMNEIGTDCMGE